MVGMLIPFMDPNTSMVEISSKSIEKYVFHEMQYNNMSVWNKILSVLLVQCTSVFFYIMGITICTKTMLRKVNERIYPQFFEELLNHSIGI